MCISLFASCTMVPPAGDGTGNNGGGTDNPGGNNTDKPSGGGGQVGNDDKPFTPEINGPFKGEVKLPDKTLYILGETADKAYYIKTTANIASGIELYTETVEDAPGEVRIFFYNADNSKSYIESYESNGNTGRLRITKFPSNSYKYDSTLKTYVFKGVSKTYYMGTYTASSGVTYETVSCLDASYATGSNIDKLDVTQFPLRLVEDKGTTPSEPTRLSAPTVSISEDGTASWSAVNGAYGYKYMINGAEELPTASLSVKLKNGDNIRVKAIGDGKNYTDSDWSAPKTYTAPQGGYVPTVEGPFKGEMVFPNKSVYMQGDTGAKPYYINIGDNKDDGVDLYTETVEGTDGGVHIYFMKDGEKVFLDIYEEKDETGRVKLSSTSTVTYVYNSIIKAYTVTIGSNTYYLGTYIVSGNTEPYASVSCSHIKYVTGDNLSKLDVTQFPLRLVEVGGDVTPPVVDPPVDDTNAPEYLRIEVTKTEPGTANAALYSALSNDEIEKILKNYYENGTETLPPSSNYPLYTKAGDTVYVSIWLNNPNQCTILSMTINGVKYQIGGALRSYFYSDGTNCVFAEIRIPEDSEALETYTVTEVQYIESDNQVSGNGKQVLLGDKETSVSVGLLYNADVTAEIDETTVIIGNNSFSANVKIQDTYGLIGQTQGWLRAALIGAGAVETERSISKGNITIAFDDIPEAREYTLVILGYYDRQDGNGAAPEILAVYSFTTGVRVNLTAVGDYESYNGKLGAMITVLAAFEEKDSASAITITDKNGSKVYSANADEINAFNTNKEIALRSDAFLNGNLYTVSVTYGEAGRIQSVSLTTPRLMIPVLADCNSVELVDSAHKGDSVYFENGLYTDYDPVSDTSAYYFYPEYKTGSYGSSYLPDGAAEWINVLKTHTTASAQIKEHALIFPENAGTLLSYELVLTDARIDSPTYGEILYGLNNEFEGLFALEKESGYTFSHGIYNGDEYVTSLKTTEIVKLISSVRVSENMLDTMDIKLRYTVDLNDGGEPVTVEARVPYEKLYDINAELLASDKYSITTDGHNNAVLKYSAVSYPDKLYLMPNGYIYTESMGWINASPNIYSFRYDGNAVDGIWGPEIKFYENHVASIDVDRTLPEFNQFRFIYYNDYVGEGMITVPTQESKMSRAIINVRPGKWASQAEYCLSVDPVFSFTSEEMAELENYIYELEEEWIKAYLGAAKALKPGESLAAIPVPDFTKQHTKNITVDLTKFPNGSYVLAEDTGYINYVWYEGCKYEESIFPGEFGEVFYDEKAVLNLYRETLTSPTNIRFDNLTVLWDKVENATLYTVKVTFTNKYDELITRYYNLVPGEDGAIPTSCSISEILMFTAGSPDVKVEVMASAKLTFKESEDDIFYVYPVGDSPYSDAITYEQKKLDIGDLEYLIDFTPYLDTDNIWHDNHAYLKVWCELPDIYGTQGDVYYSINGGEFISGTSSKYILNYEGDLYCAKYGDEIKLYIKSSNIVNADSDVITLKLDVKSVNAYIDLQNTVISSAHPSDILGVHFQGENSEYGIAQELFPFKYSVEYRFKAGDILVGNPTGMYLPKGEVIELRYVIEFYSHAESFGTGKVYGEWLSLTAENDVDAFIYTLDGGNATITAYRDTPSNVIIPESIDGYPVTAIGPAVFSATPYVESITITASVTVIDSAAFDGLSNLKALTVAEGNTAYKSMTGVIYNSDATEILFVPIDLTGDIVIPETVTKIYANTFKNRANITGLVLPSSLIRLEIDSFHGCTGIKTLTIKPQKLHSPYDQDASPSSEGLYELFGYGNIPVFETITVLGDAPSNYFFYNIKTDVLIVHESLTAFATGGLRELKMNTLRIESKSFVPDTSFSSGLNGREGLTLYLNMRSIPEAVLKDNTSVTVMEFGDNVVVIGADALRGCKTLTEVKFGAKVKAVYAGAFRDCTSLKTVNLEGLTEIKNGGFQNCGFETLTIDHNMTIASYAFADNTKLTTLSISGVSEIASSSFRACTALRTLTLGEGITVINDNAFASSNAIEVYNLTGLTITAGTDEGGRAASGAYAVYTSLDAERLVKETEDGFLYANGVIIAYLGALTDVTLPESLDGASYTVSLNDKKSTKLPEIIRIHESWTSLPDSFFKNSDLSATIDLKNVVNIGTSAFEGSNGAANIDLSKVKTIGARAFYNATIPTVIDLRSIESIGEKAFNKYVGFEAVDITIVLGKNATLASKAFYESYTDPLCVKAIYYYGTEEDKSSLNLSSNTALSSLTWYFYSENDPFESGDIYEGNFWHYDENGSIAIWVF